MKKLISSIADLVWVAQAYLRGKVLRQKEYRPLMSFMVPVTGKRLMILMRLWKIRPLSTSLATELVKNPILSEPPPSLYLSPAIFWNQNQGRWEWYSDKGWENPKFLFRK